MTQRRRWANTSNARRWKPSGESRDGRRGFGFRSNIRSYQPPSFPPPACSDGGGGGDSVTAYYRSEFSVPAPQQASADMAVQSLQTAAGSPQSRQGRVLLKPQRSLNVDAVVTRGQSPPHRSTVNQASCLYFYLDVHVYKCAIFVCSHRSAHDVTILIG